ncbi:hypothetical protein LJC46_05835 [Desulfovibrio sp. OttesenSCG-928-G15]|nr:hypothetical protein [Desulfovibrio sp. OttesenSCG-928-G15]
MQRLFISLLIFSALGLTACGKSQIIKDSWKFTNRQYRSYLNTPAQLDMDDIGSCEPYELALGDALMRVDAQLHRLVRSMENSDSNPDQGWVLRMMNDFSWLSGVALVGPQGEQIARYPEDYPKPFDVTPLLVADPKQKIGDLRAYVQQTEFGPEIYIANPVYGGETLRGLVVAYFDPRVLAGMSRDPNNIMIVGPNGVLWAGNQGASTVVHQQDWEQVLKNKSCGTLGDSKTGYFWTTRYLGNLPLVYAVPLSAGKAIEAILEKQPEQGEITPAPVADNETASQ